MHGSRRRYLFAIIVGLIALLIGGSYAYNEFEQAARQRQPSYKYQPAERPSLPKVMAGKPTPPQYQPYCQQPNNRDDADLCAQWAAVQQVAESNRMASLNVRLGIASLLATIFGTGLLVWTLIETRETARRELRAYVSVRPVSLHTFRDAGKPVVEIELTNGGATPAYGLVHYGNIVVREMPLENDPLANFSGEWIGIPAPFVLHGAGVTGGSIQAHAPITEAGLEAVMKGDKGLYVIGNAEYRDTFGRRRVTEFCYCLSGSEFSAMRSQSRAQPGKPIPMTWEVGNLHNNAT